MTRQSSTDTAAGRLIVLQLLLAAAWAASALAAPPTQDLKPGKGKLHPKKGYESVVLWRIQVEDLTGDASGYHPRVVIGPPGSSERIASGRIVEVSPGDYFSTYATASAVDGEWVHEGATHTFDGLFAVEAIPGTYEWFQFKLDKQNTGIGSSVAVLTLPPAPCTVSTGQVLYLGALKITVEERISGTEMYRFAVETTAGDLDSDLASARRLFPRVLSELPGEPVTHCTLGEDSAERHQTPPEGSSQ